MVHCRIGASRDYGCGRFLAPELILFWAIQQWLVAGEIADINERARKRRRAVEKPRVAEGGDSIEKNASTATDTCQEREELLRKTDEEIVERAVMEGKNWRMTTKVCLFLFETVTIC